MQYQSIVEKMSEYLLVASVGLARWLDNRLPKSSDWWNTLVLSKLTGNQRTISDNNGVSELSYLDLSSLLRVADKNWYVISQKYFLNYTERDRLKSMFTVRNRWAHPAPEVVDVSRILADLELIYDFCGQIGEDKTALINIQKFISAVKTEGVTDAPDNQPQEIHNPSAVAWQSGEIAQGSIVHLKSDTKVTGVVISVTKVGDTVKYDVFIDGAIKTYFAEQIEAHDIVEKTKTTDIEDFRRILTARQIMNPSSDSLYSLNSARIDFVPYQFRPVLKLIKSETPRLLIADSVGVGKTIEAGLILKEMQMRSSLDTVIIICPKPLVAERKWEIEMREKFGEDFIPIDSGTLRHILLDYERDGVWDERYKRLIIPYSILTEELLNGTVGKKHHSGLVSLDPPPVFDLLIVDEAHHIRNSNTQSHRVVKFFCEHASAALFLTATPIQLGNQDLYTLLNLLFPDIVIDKASFEAMAQPNEHINKAVRFLRGGAGYESDALDSLREAVGTDWGRNVIAPNPVYINVISALSNGELTRERRVSLINDVESLHSFSQMINRTRRQDIGEFCIRRPYTLKTDFTEPQRELHDELLDFERKVLTVLHGNISAKFLMNTISRQAASCLFGIAPFIKDLVAKRLSELFDEHDEDAENIDVDFGQFGETAKHIIELAENLPSDDPKFDALAGILRERQKPDGGKTIVFSSFRHTLNYLHKRIMNDLSLRVEQVNGSIPDEERFKLRERFALPKGNPNAIDVLLFTEVGSEGLDYQFCNAMVNYDLPWNPMRIEQRIGRIDRRGQMSETVHIYNCIVNCTIDADIYDRCFMRIGLFEHSLGECSDILGNIENSIKNIIFDSALTAEERSRKIEQMADNEIRLINENRKLEEEGKEMFGLDISGFADDLVKADNPWVSPDGIRRLVEGYLAKRLGNEKQYISAGRLKLTSSEKLLLLDDYQEISDRAPDKIWEAYLKSGKDVFQISFMQDEAKNNRKCLFVTLLHPLARQAAECYGFTSNTRIALSFCGGEVPAGQYPFLLYWWEYTSLRPRDELVAVCENENIRGEILTLLQSAVSSQTDISNFVTDWDKLEREHLAMWRQEKEHFTAEIQSNCRFKVESLTRSLNARKLIAERQLAETSDTKIERMRRAELERLEGDFSAKKSRIEKIAETADIHATLLASGVITVTEE